MLAAQPEEGDHLLVYQTSTSDAGLVDRLRETGLECRIYGLRRGLRTEERDGNLRFLPFSDEGFVDDLRSARAVVANGGFTLLGEAVYLHRPVLSVPVRHQFEQVLNARYLEREGFGLAAEAVTGEVLGRFLERGPSCGASSRPTGRTGTGISSPTSMRSSPRRDGTGTIRPANRTL